MLKASIRSEMTFRSHWNPNDAETRRNASKTAGSPSGIRDFIGSFTTTEEYPDGIVARQNGVEAQTALLTTR